MRLLSLRGSLLSRNRSCLPCQDILVLEVDGMNQAVAYWQTYTIVRPQDSVRACENTVTLNTEHSDVSQSLSKSHRYDVPGRG